MSSRKTYFGIGWSGKDPTATEKSQDGDDRSDYSAPTVVDDEKVAEGLKQLRAWYQPDPNAPPVPDDRESVVDAPSEPTKLGMPYPRPTAVGHAAATEQQQAEQRPVVPDPMRGTMFGHDVHRPEFDSQSGADDRSMVPMSYQIVDDGPARHAETAQHPSEGVPHVDAGHEGPAPFADFLRREAERPRRAGGFHLSRPDDTDSIAVPRARMTARILFAAFGVAAFVTAVVVWLQPGSPDPMSSGPAFGVNGGQPGTPASADPGAARAAAAAAGTTETIKPAAPPADTVKPIGNAVKPVGADVLVAPARVPPPASEIPRARTDAPRRTATAKIPLVKDDDSAGGGDTTTAAVPAPGETTTTTPPAKIERTEPRSRTGRTPARKADSEGAAPDRDKPAGKQEDPDSTLPPSED